jgi:hypothetical protein
VRRRAEGGILARDLDQVDATAHDHGRTAPDRLDQAGGDLVDVAAIEHGPALPWPHERPRPSQP